MTSVDSTEPAGDFPTQKCGSCDGGPARCWCVDCSEALCHDCVSAHRRVTVTRRHKLLDQAPPEVLSISPTKFCSLHPSEALRLFCFRCNQITCRDCQLVAHQNHSFEFISKAVESLKKQLVSSIQPLQEQMRASRRSIIDMEERLAALSQHETFIQTKLQKNFSALALFLSRRLEKVLKEVQKIHAWERQQIQTRMLKVRELQRGCMAVTAAAVQAQNTTDLLELLGCMAQIKPQVKQLVSQDSAPPEAMACLRVVTDQKSMDTILQFGKIEVSWVPFSASQTPKQDPSSFHEVAPPTSSSSFCGIAPPTSSSFNGVAPLTSSSSFCGIAPPTSSSFNGTAPPTSSSSFCVVAPPTSSSFGGVAPPTSSSFGGVAPPTSSSFGGVAPPTSSSFGGVAPPTSSSSFCGIAPPTSSSFNSTAPPTSSSFNGVAPPTSSSSFGGIAPPTSSSFNGTAPPTSSSSFCVVAPPTSSLSLSGIAPPIFSSIRGNAPPTSCIAPPTSLSLSGVAPPSYFSSFSSTAPPTSSSFSVSSETPPPSVSQSAAPSLPPSSSWHRSKLAPPVHASDAPPAPRPPPLGVSSTAPADPRKTNPADGVCSSQLHPSPGQTQPTPSLLGSSSAPPPTSPDPPGAPPPQTTAAASSNVRINVISRSEVAALSRLFQWPMKERDPPREKPVPDSRRHPPRKTKSSGGVSTAPESTNHNPPCSPPIAPVSDPDDPPQQHQLSMLTPGGLPRPPPSLLKELDPPLTPQRSRDRPPSLEELSPDPGSGRESWTGPSESSRLCRGGPVSSPAAEPSEPVPPQTPDPAPSFSVEPEPPEKPGSPPTEEPSSVPCGGPSPDGGARTHGGGAPPSSAPKHLLQPRVSLFRLPLSWSGPGQPLPRFRLTLGDAEDEIYMQEIAQSPRDFPGSPFPDHSSWYRQNSDSVRDFTEPLSLEILSCSSCGASDASKICVSCGRGYHQDCHVPPVGPDIWSEWICSLCQDLSDPSDPFSSDRPAGPQTSGLGLLDQRKCETLVLHLLVESCARLSQSGFLLDLTRISERLTCRALPGFQRVEDLVSELWTLMEDSSQDDPLNDLRESFHRKMKDMFGSELPLLLRRASNTPPGGGGGSSPTRGAPGPKEVDAETVKVRGEAERTGRRSKLEVLRRRLRDFLDTKQLPPGKRMKTD